MAEEKNKKDESTDSEQEGFDYIVENVADDVAEDIKKIHKKMKKAQKEAKEYLDGWQRERANFANYKKEIQKTIDESKRYIKEDAAEKLLEVADNFELMMRHASKEIQASEWYTGVEQAYKQMTVKLREMEVHEIEVKPGDEFDPAIHWAVEGEGDTVDEVMQKGYWMGHIAGGVEEGKVVRPAKVVLKK
ncbi:MAG: nucleotide exchange factor GrpE [Candidatus Spechtbacterales bacterium]